MTSFGKKIMNAMQWDKTIHEETLKKLNNIIQELENENLGILFVGGTGSGKSSTINALFENQGRQVAAVGTGAKPHTMDIIYYELDNLTIYDSPGLGDGTEKDKIHTEKIQKLLCEKNEKGEAKVDLVVVIINGSSRDLESVYKLINDVLKEYIEKKRILVAINQCDRVLTTPGAFDYVKNQPSEKLLKTLDEWAAQIQERIAKDTGVNVDVIYYAAGYTDEDTGIKQPSYNLSKLLYYISKHTPKTKRLVIGKNINEEEIEKETNDKKEDYEKNTEKSWWDTIYEKAKEIIGEIPMVKFTKTIIDIIKK